MSTRAPFKSSWLRSCDQFPVLECQVEVIEWSIESANLLRGSAAIDACSVNIELSVLD